MLRGPRGRSRRRHQHETAGQPAAEDIGDPVRIEVEREQSDRGGKEDRHARHQPPMLLREHGQRAVEDDGVRGVPGREDVATMERQIGVARRQWSQPSDEDLHDADREVEQEQRGRDQDQGPQRPRAPRPPDQPRKDGQR